MAYIQEKEKAIALRKKGKSLEEIAVLTKMNKSTVAYWCREVPLTRIQETDLLKRTRFLGMEKLLRTIKEKKKERQLESYYYEAKGVSDVGDIKRRDLFMLGLALYWGEGYKKGNAECAFTNSDPYMVKVMLRWFKEIYNIRNEMFTLRISINEKQKHRVGKLVPFWSKITGVPTGQFTKTSFIKSKVRKIYSNEAIYFGTLRLKIKNGSMLRKRILSSIEAVGAHTD